MACPSRGAWRLGTMLAESGRTEKGARRCRLACSGLGNLEGRGAACFRASSASIMGFPVGVMHQQPRHSASTKELYRACAQAWLGT